MKEGTGPAICPLCHGRLATDYEASEQEMTVVLICTECQCSFDLAPRKREEDGEKKKGS